MFSNKCSRTRLKTLTLRLQYTSSVWACLSVPISCKASHPFRLGIVVVVNAITLFITDHPAESEDDMWSAATCSMGGAKLEETSEDYDFVYVSEILRASNYLPEEADIFLLLEKQQYLKGKDTSKASTLQRRLIFDTIHEILNRNRQLPPWKAISWIGQTPLLQRIWSEFRRIRREREESEDLFDVICGVLRKDLAEDSMNGWGECPVEMGEVVLDIERLVFKDLIGETIRDLAAFAGKSNRITALRRKLVF